MTRGGPEYDIGAIADMRQYQQRKEASAAQIAEVVVFDAATNRVAHQGASRAQSERMGR